jgi:preprotein translocase subunit YajC
VAIISSAHAQTVSTGSSLSFLDLNSDLTSFFPVILMFAVLYFLMVRPQMKRQKEHKNMIEALSKGDEIVTNGGVLGKITKVMDSHVTLEIANGAEVLSQKSSVTTLLPKGTIKSLL